VRHADGECPLWVISGHFVTLGPCPLYPQKQTLVEGVGMSALCQKRTHAPQQFNRYSITSSVRASSEAGTVRPSVFAVLRLIASSNFVGKRCGPEGPGIDQREVGGSKRKKICVEMDADHSEARPELSTLATSVAGLRLSSSKRASTRSGMSKPSVNQP
jgi:hypothetical protein